MIESNLLPIDNNSREMQKLTMWYHDKSCEKNYRKLPNPRFRYDLACACVIFVAVAIMQLVVFKRSVNNLELFIFILYCLNDFFSEPTLLICLSTAATILALLVYLCFISYNIDDASQTPSHRRGGWSIAENNIVQASLFFIASLAAVLSTSLSILNLVICLEFCIFCVLFSVILFSDYTRFKPGFYTEHNYREKCRIC